MEETAVPVSTEQATEATTEAPVETPVEEQPVQPEAPQEKVYKIAISGEERELPESEVLKLASLAGGANKSFQEAAEAKKQIAAIIETLETNPFTLIEKMGKDPKALAEDYLLGIYNKDALPPEQKELLTKKEDLERREAEIARVTKENQKMLENHFTEHFQREIPRAMSEVGLPNTKDAFLRVVRVLQENPSMDTIDAAKFVESEYIEDSKKLASLDGDVILKLIGEEGLKKAHETLKRRSVPVNNSSPDLDFKTVKKTNKSLTWADLSKKLSNLTD